MKLEDCQLQVATAVLQIWFITAIGKLCKTSILHKLPNDSLLPSKMFKTKMDWGYKEHNHKCIEMSERKKKMSLLK